MFRQVRLLLMFISIAFLPIDSYAQNPLLKELAQEDRASRSGTGSLAGRCVECYYQLGPDVSMERERGLRRGGSFERRQPAVGYSH